MALAMYAGHAEGWGLFEVDFTGLVEIQRLDEAAAFDSDEHAVKFVRTRAIDGSQMHIAALVEHERFCTALASLRA